MHQQYSTRAVDPDGNCFYRAMSLALYGTQNYHWYLRLLTAIELIHNPNLYSSDNPACVTKNLPVITPEYRHLLRGTLCKGSFSEIVHLFALSSALTLPIQSYCCPYDATSLHPYTVLIKQSSYECTFQTGFLSLMWTSASCADSQPNHFVLLVPIQESTCLYLDTAQTVHESISCTSSNREDVEPDESAETTHVNPADHRNSEMVSGE